jgi:hypothetical protein
MPHTLTLTYTPRLRSYARQISGWRRVQTLADAAVASFVTLWRGLFRDAREALPLGTLTEALTQPQILDAVAVLDTTWHTAVEAPAWMLLPPLATTLVQDAGTASLPALEAQLGVSLTMTPFLQETEHWITTYVGTQIRDITATSRAAIRAVLREGWTAGQNPGELARALRQVVGLTPRQAATVGRLRETLAAEGKTAVQISRAVEQATARGIQQRALVIARSESQSLAARGVWDAMSQTIRAGIVQADQVRGFWRIAEDEVTCPICTEIPILNPDGVAWEEPFQTPVGLLLMPIAHPNCRCTVDYRIT